ncbi:MAG: hypothetical protein RJA99_4272 [Pseudomonadota bacterium]
MKAGLSGVLVAALLVGCGSGGLFGDDCGDKMDAAKRDYGNPERSTSYDSGDYHSVTYWWYKKGLSKTFTWSGSESCKVSDYRFTPF